MSDMGDFVDDDELAIDPLSDLGWKVEMVAWQDRNVDWAQFDLIVVRSTWNYHYHPEEFVQVLKEIERSGAPLQNPLSIIEWNMRKTYLRELEQNGHSIVPTIWSESPIDSDSFATWQERLQSEELIIKPIIGATASNTFRLTSSQSTVAEIFRDQLFMVQPFLQNIIDEGEYSLFFFNGLLSHTTVKKPKQGDFRVQEEHGGLIESVPAPPKLPELGLRVLKSLPELPLYARVDYVRLPNDEFAIIELELIEPSLYLRMDTSAPIRFANALDQWHKNATINSK